MKKVILVGMIGPYTDNSGPVDKDTEIWGATCTYRYQKAPHTPLSRIYAMHPLICHTKGLGIEEFIAGCNDMGGPVIMLKHYPEIPKSRAFELRERLIQFGFIAEDDSRSLDEIIQDGVGYSTSTVTYMLMDAIAEGFDEITIHKFQAYSATPEYFEQKSCLDFWLGYAHGKGIKIRLSSDSNLMRPSPWQPALYGYMLCPQQEQIQMTFASVVSGIQHMDVHHFQTIDGTFDEKNLVAPQKVAIA